MYFFFAVKRYNIISSIGSRLLGKQVAIFRRLLITKIAQIDDRTDLGFKRSCTGCIIKKLSRKCFGCISVFKSGTKEEFLVSRCNLGLKLEIQDTFF